MPDPIKRRFPAAGENWLGRPKPDYSKAFYPDPPSHDFCTWLIMAELMRRHHGAEEPLRVKFGLISGQLGVVDFGPLSPWGEASYQCGVSREYHDEMLENVMRPAMAMIGAVEEPAIDIPWDVNELRGYVEYDYHAWQLVDAARAGFEIPKWEVPQWAHDEVKEFLGSQKPVIITLRETPAQPERNSRIDDWLKFADTIEGEHKVLFLRDTCNAEGQLAGFVTWPRASRNAYVRAALYQRALVNMMVGTGPMTWCSHSDAPYLFFKQLVPELPQWGQGSAAGWKEQEHMNVGNSFPWASPRQRFTWTDDTFENICAAFDEFVGAK